ncbi:MAG: NUDIX hydrolase [Faecalibacterium prausnitzii]
MEYPIISTTLCYLERDDAYLMLHRVKKEDDYNHDKWVGVGGKFERFESPEDCLLREVKEETGLTLTHWRSRGLLTFIWGNMTEFIHLYTADGWTGEMIQGDACREGVLEWVPKEKVEQLPIWEGDKIALRSCSTRNIRGSPSSWCMRGMSSGRRCWREKGSWLICQRRKHFTEKLAQHGIHALRRPDGGDHQLVGVDAGKIN